MRKIILLIIVLTCLGKYNTNAQYWSTLGEGMATTSPDGVIWLNSLAMYNGELYAGGIFDSAGGIGAKNIAKWNGTNWSTVGTGVNGVVGQVRAMIVYGGELFVGGFFSNAGGVAAKNIAKWNGTNWAPVGPGVNNVVLDFAVLNGELYAAGAFDTAGSVVANRIAKWNGVNWAPVGEGIDPDWYVDHLTAVYSLTAHNGILYAGGGFDTAGTVPANNIAKWDGSNWSALDLGLGGGIVYSLADYNGDIYAGGSFWRTGASDYVNHIAKWNGTNWSSVGEGTDFASAALAVYNGHLYAGGFYPSYSDGTGDGVGETVPTNYISKWDGVYWSSVGRGVFGTVFKLLPADSALYVGGGLTFADTFPANKIAKWLGNCSNPSRPDTIYGNKSICAGSTQSYFINEVSGATYYTWVLPEYWPGYSTTDSITTVAYYDGEHTISVMANNGCGNSPPQTLTITAVPFYPPDYIYGNSPVCPGSTQTYFVNPVQGATSYSWNLPSGWSGNSATDSITVTVGSDPGIISVTAHGNCGSSYAQTLEVSISSTPSQPGLIMGADTICQASTQSYSVSPATDATSYTWNLPTGWLGFSNSNTITVESGLNGGSISVFANNSCGASIPQTILITTETVPAVPLSIIGNDTVCEGSSQTYFIDPVPRAAGYAWDLTFGTAFGVDSTAVTITAQHSGYPGDFITVLAYNNCGSSDMLSLPVKVNLRPYQPQRIFGNNLVCRGSDQTYFIDPLPDASSYTWIIPAGWIGNSNSSSITVDVGNDPGEILVRANNSCGGGAFKSLQVLLDTFPSKPGSINGNVYVTAGEKHGYYVDIPGRPPGYNWSLSGGGDLAVGQSPHKIEIDWHTPGTYVLSVNAVTSCGLSTDQKLNITVSAGNEKDPYGLQLFPNPSTGEFSLKAKRLQDKWVSIKVINMSGQLVFNSEKTLGSNNYYQLINLDNVAPGIYAVKIIIDDKAYTKKVLITN